MALLDVCGINSIVNFNSPQVKDDLENEVETYSRNFSNNLSLAVQPAFHVSYRNPQITANRQTLRPNLQTHSPNYYRSSDTP